ncbi:hypothetical protein M441DRAFT_229661 [Trichoderma asperellum CBS 433.97]|uniref:Uncharacterized protein n=1 Tax=Trichoderma asperellum (strain ATCC 204424 / CBS 433.97 / NBRC 101777) TaxID=1042311 RepID=A0A2T3ZQD6_TRIA4|nr:hypothetical protein M441DRAFT_229661 [Trichoderma asperellum CBS 433.97]PTB47041.1 hypothetical protein M441DRAFT_229661 [Trichoderma asperellum CBS 433.97]
MARLAITLSHRLALRLKMQSTCTCTEQTCRRHLRRLCGSSATVENPSLMCTHLLMKRSRCNTSALLTRCPKSPDRPHQPCTTTSACTLACSSGQLAASSSRISAAACGIGCGVCGVSQSR